MAALPSAERRARVADSLFFRWRGRPGLGEAAARALWIEADALEAAGRPTAAAARLEELRRTSRTADRRRRAAWRLAGLRVRLGREPSALRVLARTPTAGGDARRDRVRQAAAGLSTAELARAAGLFGPETPERGVVLAERARALALAGRADSARAAAEAALAAPLPEADRATARAVLDGEVGPAEASPPRIGLILPLTGDLRSIGELLRQAAALAAGVDSAQLVVRDDSSRAETVPRIVRELERAGVSAVVGPITSGGFRAAVEARSDPALPVVSPAASTAPVRVPNAYTLWDRETRVRNLSRALGAWVPERAGLRRLGLLRAESEAGRTYEHGFRSGARRAGGWVAAAASFDPDSTTFEGPVRWLASNRPETLLAGTSDPRTVLQMAPQLSFYGLRSALVAGTSAWGQPITVRRLSGGFPSRWVAAVFADRTGEGTAWSRFETAYERRYRRGLPSRTLPALAHDAVRWTAASLGPDRLPRRGVVARGLAAGEFEGASGRFRARPEASAVDREVRIRMAADGRLHAPDTAALRAWRREAGRLADAGRRRTRQEAAKRVREWLRRHGDSVRVDSARVRVRERRLRERELRRPAADTLPPADTTAGGRGARRDQRERPEEGERR